MLFTHFFEYSLCRVKELGADEGSNIPMEDDELMLANDDDDFDLIQSTNMVSFFFKSFSLVY